MVAVDRPHGAPTRPARIGAAQAGANASPTSDAFCENAGPPGHTELAAPARTRAGSARHEHGSTSAIGPDEDTPTWMSEPISDEQRKRREQSKHAKARTAARRRAAERESKARAAKTPLPEFHKCSICGTRIRVEFKRCRRCAGIRGRADVDAMQRRVPGSFESNSH